MALSDSQFVVRVRCRVAPLSAISRSRDRAPNVINMYSWVNAETEEEEKEATWSDVAQLYLDLLKCVHVSECDREEKPVVYLGIVPSDPLKEILIEQYPLLKRLNNGDGKTQDNVDNGADEESSEDEEDLVLPPITLLTCFYIQTHKGTYRILWRLSHSSVYSSHTIEFKLDSNVPLTNPSHPQYPYNKRTRITPQNAYRIPHTQSSPKVRSFTLSTDTLIS